MIFSLLKLKSSTFGKVIFGPRKCISAVGKCLSYTGGSVTETVTIKWHLSDELPLVKLIAIEQWLDFAEVIFKLSV